MCVKFSNLTIVRDDAGVEPPVSVAAVAAGRVARLPLIEIELGNGLQLFRQPRPVETGRQMVEPGAVFVLQLDERCYRRRPALRPGGSRDGMTSSYLAQPVPPSQPPDKLRPPRSRNSFAGLFPYRYGGLVRNGVETTFDPETDVQPGAPGPFAHPHQFSVALTVPEPGLSTPICWPRRLFR